MTATQLPALAGTVEELAAMLPARYGRLLLLRHRDGHSAESAAAAMGVSVATVADYEARMNRAIVAACRQHRAAMSPRDQAQEALRDLLAEREVPG